MYSLKINLQKLDVLPFSRSPLVPAAGGCKQKVEPRLTLKREDSTLYHLALCLNEKVSGATVFFRAESRQRQLLTSCFASSFQGQGPRGEARPDGGPGEELRQQQSHFLRHRAALGQKRRSSLNSSGSNFSLCLLLGMIKRQSVT